MTIKDGKITAISRAEAIHIWITKCTHMSYKSFTEMIEKNGIKILK